MGDLKQEKFCDDVYVKFFGNVIQCICQQDKWLVCVGIWLVCVQEDEYYVDCLVEGIGGDLKYSFFVQFFQWQLLKVIE